MKKSILILSTLILATTLTACTKAPTNPTNKQSTTQVRPDTITKVSYPITKSVPNQTKVVVTTEKGHYNAEIKDNKLIYEGIAPSKENKIISVETEKETIKNLKLSEIKDDKGNFTTSIPFSQDVRAIRAEYQNTINGGIATKFELLFSKPEPPNEPTEYKVTLDIPEVLQDEIKLIITTKDKEIPID